MGNKMSKDFSRRKTREIKAKNIQIKLGKYCFGLHNPPSKEYIEVNICQ